MEFGVKIGHPAKQRTHCIIVGIFENQKLPPTSEQFNQASGNYIGNLQQLGDVEGKTGQTLLLHQVPNTQCDWVLLVGCGRERELKDKEFRDLLRKAIQAVIQNNAIEVVCFLTALTVENRDIQWKIKQAVEITSEILYAFDAFKSKKEHKSLGLLTFIVSTKRELVYGERALLEGQATAQGVAFAKDLANLPPNVCTPLYLAKEAEKLALEFKSISTAILDQNDIAALKMGAFLAVAQGSQFPPRLITLEYRGSTGKYKTKPIVLVGKGITFDTGGNSLKPPAGMIGMKYDMCGAACVLAVIRAAAMLKLPLNIVGIVPTAENMPGNQATRPEDIVTSMAGITIEILNTDAEGRLILCDALTYCERFNPEVVIDIATLTSACITALGSHASGLFSNYNPLANDLLNAGITSGDRCWQMPLWEEYQDALNSRFADIANVGSPPEGGAILAASFLAYFTEKYHWAHLDVAGTASRPAGKDRGATGRPVPLMVQYLLDRCQNPTQNGRRAVLDVPKARQKGERYQKQRKSKRSMAQ
jgi:leucyl aminopeptidase